MSKMSQLHADSAPERADDAGRHIKFLIHLIDDLTMKARAVTDAHEEYEGDLDLASADDLIDQLRRACDDARLYANLP